MSYIGALAVIFAAFLIWKEYVSYLDGELAGCRAFLSALKDYRERVRCYLISPSEWASTYNDDLLTECGFLASVLEGVDLPRAYSSARESLNLSEDVDEILKECFGRLGNGYLDTELAVLDLAISGLAEIESQSSPEVRNKRRAAGALLGACVSGIVIIII
ncbi:MAG: hypothetical protein IJW53_01695 [Clostridia bacterium]|nr:hypothetical protein [Clostridia bacterium]